MSWPIMWVGSSLATRAPDMPSTGKSRSFRDRSRRLRIRCRGVRVRAPSAFAGRTGVRSASEARTGCLCLYRPAFPSKPSEPLAGGMSASEMHGDPIGRPPRAQSGLPQRTVRHLLRAQSSYAALVDKGRTEPGRQSLCLSCNHFKGNTTSTGNKPRLFSASRA
jgi:hypothetical protein